MKTRKLTVLVAAAFVSSILLPSATAHGRSQEPLVVQGKIIDPETQRIVRFADLNLANPEGQKVLLRRVGFAVNDLCQVQLFATQDLQSARNAMDCSKSAWDSANPQLNAAFEGAKSGTFISAAALLITAHR